VRRWPAIAVLFVSISAAGSLAGCGGGTVRPQSVPANENLVTKDDILAVAPDSPQRSLLRWWRAVQYEDRSGHLQLLSPKLRRQRIKDGRGRYDVLLAWGAFVPAKPKIVSTEIRGNRATVFTQVYIRQLVGANRTYETSFPQAFTFVRTNGSWYLADDTFIEQKADETAAASKPSKGNK
jgi:hypothetical protein